MQDLLRETIFGRIVHLVSGGKLFPPAEQRDPSRLQRYIVTKSGSTSESSVSASSNVPLVEKRNPEKGNDYELVDWLENDSEVQCHWRNGQNHI